MTPPDDINFPSPVEPALELSDPEAAHWAESADTVVVGFGGAGVCAALAARESGAEVLALDRFEGGGATAISGGVYYGGGTRFQAEAGFEDTAEEMFAYLKQETGDAVSESTLRRFCEESNLNLEWLAAHGVPFSSAFTPAKTSYPGEGEFLYYSGNEKLPAFAARAKPAPRGHRTVGNGTTGNVFFARLREAALKAGVRLRDYCPVRRLVTNREGRVIGVEIIHLPVGSTARRRYARKARWYNRLAKLTPDSAPRYMRKLAEIEAKSGMRQLIRARRGVILSTGGFAFNRPMLKHYAPTYGDAMPIGTLGCDGSGIRLAQTVGAQVERLERVSPWRIIAPPVSYLKGAVVDRSGRRFIAEDIYCGTLGHQIVEHAGGNAWVILDEALYCELVREINPFRPGRFSFLGLLGWLSLKRSTRKARTLEELAEKCGISPSGLAEGIADYNRIARGEQDDPLGKAADYRRALGEGPYHAVDISLSNKAFPCPAITLGGLKLDEASGQALRGDGTPIPGLFAAGRTAVGVCSNYYVSGTSIADCVFSGRRAGKAAATGPAAAMDSARLQPAG